VTEPFEDFSSRVMIMPIDNIDTDQIIPARFLKTTSKQGLENNLFHDWRWQADGSPNPDFVLNQPASRGAKILLAGANFGCGSSREHAPWALLQYGFRAVISTGFADIFRSNSLKNGLLPIAVPPEVHERLFRILETNPDAEVAVDLADQKLILPDGSKTEFPIDDFSRACLLAGVDELGFILSQENAIAKYEKQSSQTLNTTA